MQFLRGNLERNWIQPWHPRINAVKVASVLEKTEFVGNDLKVVFTDTVLLLFQKSIPYLGVDGAWWLSRTSNPLCPARTGMGGFDSLTLPPEHWFLGADNDKT